WVREAADLLASTDTSLIPVALEAGFADQSHLSRVFKAEMGLTPKPSVLWPGRDNSDPGQTCSRRPARCGLCCQHGAAEPSPQLAEESIERDLGAHRSCD